MPIWSKISFQNSNSPLMEHLEFFHDHSMIILMTVTFSTLYLIYSFMKNIHIAHMLSENQEMEMFWTLIPTFMLSFIALPSLKILYMTDELPEANFSLKTLGNQWYWTYEYSNLMNLSFESFHNPIHFRNLETSNSILAPLKTPIQLITSSSDVIHSWAMPTLGIKSDAIPGRLNQIFFTINRPGMTSGQCSEICGTNHSFMPISLISINMNKMF